MDGWGLAAPGKGNAVSLADTPVFDTLMRGPHTSLKCCGPDVGLPPGFMGNSEVGHMNLGAGRVVNQDIRRIDLAVSNGSFAKNPVLTELFERARNQSGRVHFMGLLSDSGVHSHIGHLFALLGYARAQGLHSIVHAFMDGRDASPTSGADFVRKLLGTLNRLGKCRLGSMVGRYYAMDRDKRWERTGKAWNLMVHGQGERTENPVQALEDAYAKGETDEFILPRLIDNGSGESPCIQDGDALFYFNFRADRARQLTRCFADSSFDGFDRGRLPHLSAFATMTRYEDDLPVPAALPTEDIPQVLGQVASSMGIEQLRIAETEKYAHVTYFFNGGIEEPFAGEDRILVQSPRDVATYDLKPEMSAEQVATRFAKAWLQKRYPLVICNFANADMVGHTGVIPAAIRACETVDACVGKLLRLAEENGCRMLITADHGNAECLLTPTGKPFTSHTLNPVPLFLLEDGKQLPLLDGGRLADVAPTILHLWGVNPPDVMNGHTLFEVQ